VATCVQTGSVFAVVGYLANNGLGLAYIIYCVVRKSWSWLCPLCFDCSVGETSPHAARERCLLTVALVAVASGVSCWTHVLFCCCVSSSSLQLFSLFGVKVLLHPAQVRKYLVRPVWVLRLRHSIEARARLVRG
jgi:hypothetical protein